jgi:hypothetical protein
MTNTNRSGRRREFSREEDELIVLQSTGDVTMAHLLKRLRTSREIVERRAMELGVVPYVRAQFTDSGPPLVADDPPPAPSRQLVDSGVNPYRNEPDRLLNRLNEQHGDRRYESITIKRGK